MLRISLDLRRTAFVAARQHWNRIRAERERRRIELRTPKNDPFRLSYVRDDGLRRHLRTAAQASQGERGAHQLQEFAPGNVVADPLGSLARKFAMEHLLEFFRA